MRGVSAAAPPRRAGIRHAARYPSSRAMRLLPSQPTGLACRVRLADGRLFTRELPPERHRAIQLGLLHADTHGLVELTPGTRTGDGRLLVDRRRRAEHFLPGGRWGRVEWLEELLAHAEAIVSGAF